MKKFRTKNNHKGLVIRDITYIDSYLIVNKTYSLPQSYGNKLNRKLLKTFKKMQNAALKEEIEIKILSGFRSYDRQKQIYNKYFEEDSKNVDNYSARPGHSEHQSGLAIDVNDASDTFIDSKEAKWLDKNAYKYGFILRYPKNKSNITGYKYEPWHYRYVGKKLAKKLYNNGLWKTMEEYFGIDSKYLKNKQNMI